MSPIEAHLFHRTLKEEWPLISHGEGVCLYDTEGSGCLALIHI